MNPLLMDAVVAAHQDELRRSAHRPRLARRPSRVRSLLHPTTWSSRDESPRGPANRMA